MDDDTKKNTITNNDAFEDSFSQTSNSDLNSSSDVFVFDPSGDDVMIVAANAQDIAAEDQGAFNSRLTPSDNFVVPKRAQDISEFEDDIDDEY